MGTRSADDGEQPIQRFFFVHIMKTAGTTFALHLRQNFRPEEIYPNADIDLLSPTDAEPYRRVPHLLALGPERRAAVRIYSGHFPFVAAQLMDRDLLTLSILRHPMDRTISLLKHFQARPTSYHDQPLEAIYDDPAIFRQYIENHQTKIFSLTRADGPLGMASTSGNSPSASALDHQPVANVAFGDRSTIIVDDERLRHAKRNLESVDALGLTDDYDGFIDELRERFGWWPNGLDRSGRANVSAGANDVNSSFRRRVTTDNAYDVALYEHAEDLVRTRRGDAGSHHSASK